MNAVIYTRCKNKTESTIEVQLQACYEYAKEKDYTIIDKYIDVDSREQFEQMINDSEEKDFQKVVVYSIDKFSRNEIECIINEKRLNEKGVQLVFVKENGLNEPVDLLLKSVVKGVEQYCYSEGLCQRIKEDIARKKEKQEKREKIVNEG
jgi:site-specific DNA recombinase